MIKFFKSKLLTYLFTDWVKTTTDVETLQFTYMMIKQRQIDVSGIKPIIGFKNDIKSNN
jgi:hypothetical protein